MAAEPEAPPPGDPPSPPAPPPAGSWGGLLELGQVALAVSACVLVWGLLLAYMAAPPRTADLFWHIASGRHFLELGGLTSVDPFAHTTAGETWVLQAWGFQLLVGLCDVLGGLPLVRVCATGLGLAIVKHATRAHEGRVEVESTDGVGTTFHVTLPRYLASGSSTPSPLPDPSPSSPSATVIA